MICKEVFSDVKAKTHNATLHCTSDVDSIKGSAW